MRRTSVQAWLLVVVLASPAAAQLQPPTDRPRVELYGLLGRSYLEVLYGENETAPLLGTGLLVPTDSIIALEIAALGSRDIAWFGAGFRLRLRTSAPVVARPYLALAAGHALLRDPPDRRYDRHGYTTSDYMNMPCVGWCAPPYDPGLSASGVAALVRASPGAIRRPGYSILPEALFMGGTGQGAWLAALSIVLARTL